MSTLLFKLGKLASHHPWRVVAVWLVLAASVFLLDTQVGGEANDTFRLPGAESQQAADVLGEKFTGQNPYTSQVVFDGKPLTESAMRASVAKAVDELAALPHVVGVTDPFDPHAPMVSADGRTAFTTLTFDTSDVEVMPLEGAERVVEDLRGQGLQVEYSGMLGAADAPDEPHSELIGMLFAVLVLVIAFGSLVAMSPP